LQENQYSKHNHHDSIMDFAFFPKFNVRIAPLDINGQKSIQFFA
jgi:hypothetical protein